MKQKLIDILEQFCEGHVYLQGTMNPDEAYPADFVTFWTADTEDGEHFDNVVAAIHWTFQVMYYSNNPVDVNTKPQAIAAALKAAGFVQSGRGNDLLSDEPTHTGWAMTFTITENL